MIRRLHILAGVTGFIIILGFWSLTVLSHLVGGEAAVVAVKRAIPWGLPVLIPALMLTGISGMRMGRHATIPQIAAKRRRMPVIALNGLLVLVPSALYLAHAVETRPDGTGFVAIQMVELAAGALNIMLMGLNIRDGRVAARMRRAGVGGRS